MKKVEIKETFSKYVWEAIDGTRFSSEAECKKYDESAQAVLLSHYNKLVLNSFDEENLFNCGSSDYMFDVIKFDSEEQIDTVMQLVCFFNYHVAQDLSKYESIEKICLKAFKNDDCLFIKRGCEGDKYFWVMDTLTDRLNHILKKCDQALKLKLSIKTLMENEIN